MRDIVFIAMEDWDEVWRRNQPVAAGFARRSPEHKVLFVGLSIDFSHLIRKGRFKQALRGVFRRQLTSPPGFEFDNIRLLNCVKWLPNTLSWGRAFNRWLERIHIRRACRKLGIKRPLLWINPYYATHMVGQLGEEGVVYDVGDDWTSFPQPTEWLRKLVVAEDEELTRRADAVIVVSKRLFEMKQQHARRLYHIPNGVYVERYAAVCNRTLPPHPLARNWNHPVLGYTGSVHQDRLNIDMIAALAKAYPQATIALVGPNMLDPSAAAALSAHKNILLTGPVDFSEMPQIMSAFDVCIVPHRVNDFTESLSPLKLYEYLASGLPTVATPASGFRQFPHLIHLAADNESFIEAVGVALNEPASLRRQRQVAASEHSWDARLDEIESVVATALSPNAAVAAGRMEAANAV
jgi:teichuronic acid biosynthesis glycosyltransferase TuaH